MSNAVEIYQTRDGIRPFAEWFAGLRDNRAKAKIAVRIDRIRMGNLGDHKSVGKGVQELRIDYGPGYRIYFGQDGQKLVILLTGSRKKGQQRFIKQAMIYWADYQKRKPKNA